MEFGEYIGDLSPGHRDAVHVPVVVAEVAEGERLQPGQSVAFIDVKKGTIGAAEEEYRHGILDPFLDIVAHPGEIVLVMIRPGCVSSVVHHFELDVNDIDEERERAQWCRDECGHQ